MIAMFTVGPGVLERISKYMSCDIDRLINTGIKVDENNKAQSVKSTKEIILDILNALPGNKEFSVIKHDTSVKPKYTLALLSIRIWNSILLRCSRSFLYQEHDYRSSLC